MAKAEATDRVSIVQDFFLKLDTREFSAANALLAETFLFGGWSPRPFTGNEFIQLVQGMADGMPNLQFNLHDLHESEKGATGAFQLAGTQTIDMNLPQLSLPPISETNNRISMPEEPFRAVVNNGKIEQIIVKHVAGGGAEGFIRQFGVDAPIIQP